MGGNRSGDNWRVIQRVAERVGFEPTYPLMRGNSISSRARYDRFGTSPIGKPIRVIKIDNSPVGLGQGAIRSESQFMPPLTLSEAVENSIRVNSWNSWRF